MNRVKLNPMYRERPTPRALQWSLYAGFIAWGTDLGFSYSLSQHACSTGHYYLLHLITWICFLIALTGFAAGISAWRELPEEVDKEGPGSHDIAYFEALLGMAFSLSFAVVILAAAVPRWILGACD